MGRESYSPEAFLEASEEFESESAKAEQLAKASKGPIYRSYDTELNAMFSKESKEAGNRAKEAKKRIQQLLTDGHKEANELNREYDRLLGEAESAERTLRALRTFEIEKLGMSPEEEPNVEAA